MRNLLRPIFLLVLGFTFGVIITCYLSMHASSSFIEIIRLNYQLEQRIMAIRAKKLGNMNQSAIHYANLVAATSSPGLYCFSDKREYWNMSFPISALILKKISKTFPPNTTKTQEGINRAMFADVLERLGRKEEAMTEYIKAAQLLGCNDDIVRVKEIIKGVISTDDTLLELRNNGSL